MDGERREPLEELNELSTGDLIAHITDRTRALVTDEVELARAELRADLKAELAAAAGLVLAAACGLVAISMLLVAGILALGVLMPGWGAALIAAGVALLAGILAGAYGWKRRVTSPLRRTRDSVKENVEWASERVH